MPGNVNSPAESRPQVCHRLSQCHPRRSTPVLPTAELPTAKLPAAELSIAPARHQNSPQAMPVQQQNQQSELIIRGQYTPDAGHSTPQVFRARHGPARPAAVTRRLPDNAVAIIPGIRPPVPRTQAYPSYQSDSAARSRSIPNRNTPSHNIPIAVNSSESQHWQWYVQPGVLSMRPSQQSYAAYPQRAIRNSHIRSGALRRRATLSAPIANRSAGSNYQYNQPYNNPYPAGPGRIHSTGRSVASPPHSSPPHALQCRRRSPPDRIVADRSLPRARLSIPLTLDPNDPTRQLPMNVIAEETANRPASCSAWA